MNTATATPVAPKEQFGINPKLIAPHELPPSFDVPPPDRASLIEQAKLRVGDFHRMRDAGLVNKKGDFYPSVHYPPIVMYPPLTDDELLEGYTMPADGMVDIYAHVPFCNSHCVFCHYPVKLGPQLDEKSRYLDAFLKETDIWKSRLGVDRIKARSVLVGGGTPTFLSVDQLRKFPRWILRAHRSLPVPPIQLRRGPEHAHRTGRFQASRHDARIRCGPSHHRRAVLG